MNPNIPAALLAQAMGEDFEEMLEEQKNHEANEEPRYYEEDE